MSDVIRLISDDLLIAILARLPVETLIRCTSVCKSWYSLITNPNFINTHLNHTNNHHNLYLINYFSKNSREIYSLVRCKNNVFTECAQFELPLRSFHYGYRIVGTCNGLICLSEESGLFEFEMMPIYLWNPSIRKIMELPKLGVESDDPSVHIIGFGYNLHSDDYKVVRIAYHASFDPPGEDDVFDLRNSDRGSYKTPGKVYVFSLRRGEWRDITDSGFRYAIEEDAPQAYLKGAVHWVAYDCIGGEIVPLVLSFDMGSELFSEIMMPASIPRKYGTDIVGVTKFQESLSLITGVSGGDYCVWVMREYGKDESWSMQFKIDMSGGLFHSIAGFTREGQVLVRTLRGYLAAFDPETKLITNQRINRVSAHSSHRDSFYADAYTESLVLLTLNFHDGITCEEERAIIKVEDPNQEAKEDGP